MGKVIVGATVSLDGFIADENDGVGPLSSGTATATSRRLWATPTGSST